MGQEIEHRRGEGTGSERDVIPAQRAPGKNEQDDEDEFRIPGLIERGPLAQIKFTLVAMVRRAQAQQHHAEPHRDLRQPKAASRAAGCDVVLGATTKWSARRIQLPASPATDARERHQVEHGLGDDAHTKAATASAHQRDR